MPNCELPAGAGGVQVLAVTPAGWAGALAGVGWRRAASARIDPLLIVGTAAPDSPWVLTEYYPTGDPRMAQARWHVGRCRGWAAIRREGGALSCRHRHKAGQAHGESWGAPVLRRPAHRSLMMTIVRKSNYGASNVVFRAN